MKVIAQTLKLVFRKPTYVLLAFLVMLALFSLNVFILNRGFLKAIYTSESFSWLERLELTGRTLIGIRAYMNFDDILFFILIALLAGINISILIYYLKNRFKLGIESGASILAVALSLLGVGCASCGSLILSSFLGLSASLAFLGFLPLKGFEFGLLGIVLLVWSIHRISKKIQSPVFCPWPRTDKSA